IYGKSGNHLDVMRTGYIHKNLMEFLTSKGINCTIPVAEGQSFSLASVGTSPEVVIVYDTYDAGDIRADMPNGTDSKEYMFIQYMDSSVAVTETQTVELDTSLSPAEFPDFPCGKTVPANTEIEMLGLVGCPCGEGFSTSNSIGSTYLKMVKDREVLFDTDRNGIPFFFQFSSVGPDWFSRFSLIGPCVSMVTADDGMGVTYNASLGDPLMFDPTLKFVPGEELLMYLSFDETGDRTLGDKIDIAAIMKLTQT
ncbi:unnamed protein product, partial [marine sediment metagenome]